MDMFLSVTCFMVVMNGILFQNAGCTSDSEAKFTYNVEKTFGTPSFTIDYNRDTFLKDGQPFRYISGSIHYSRVPAIYWEDRLQKMYMAGLNAIQVYVPWNFHEVAPGKYDFSGGANLTHFLTLAHQRGLLVIMRPGPYICAEWDFGGLPARLLKNTSIAIRSSDPGYLEEVDAWMSVLLPKIKPFLYQNGGPIITVQVKNGERHKRGGISTNKGDVFFFQYSGYVPDHVFASLHQVENEYGSFPACDYIYLKHLYKLMRNYLGPDIVLFSTDGGAKGYLKCGTLEGVYATVDFGPGANITSAFEAQRTYEPKGPLVNSEFYTGWLDHWGSKHVVTSIGAVTKSLDQLLEIGANVNMYMFEGGTNFGFWSGANGGGTTFLPQPTSYDYDAPLTEAGDPTPKYYAIRNVISKYFEIPVGKDPTSIPKYGYGTVLMSYQNSFYDVLDVMSPHGPSNTTYPITMEQMQQYSGFMLYRTIIPFNITSPVFIHSPAIRDRGYVMINKVHQGMLTRLDHHWLIILAATKGDVLDIFVESQGHVNFGSHMVDPKGIFGNVTLDGVILSHWSIYSLDIDRVLPHLGYSNKSRTLRDQVPPSQPAFYTGHLPDLSSVDPPQDTFLRTTGWTKGQAYLNGFNLGRYWPTEGPQVTLYVPANVLRPSPQKNTLVLFELEGAPCGLSQPCTIKFIDKPIINGTVNQLDNILGRWDDPEV